MTGPMPHRCFRRRYPGVVAVAAVDAHQKVLMEAGAGEHVRFAAPGADMLAAMPRRRIRDRARYVLCVTAGGRHARAG